MTTRRALLALPLAAAGWREARAGAQIEEPLADAVREGGVSVAAPSHGFSDPRGTTPAAASGTGGQQSGSAGRRRGHLRVLPDPAD